MASGIGDNRPERVYGILVRDHRVFVTREAQEQGLPGGIYRPLAEDRKVELAEHLRRQLGIEASAIWAQGAFQYQHPAETRERFCGFYSVWHWQGEVDSSAGEWLSEEGLAAARMPASLRILLLSVLRTEAVRTQ